MVEDEKDEDGIVIGQTRDSRPLIQSPEFETVVPRQEPEQHLTNESVPHTVSPRQPLYRQPSKIRPIIDHRFLPLHPSPQQWARTNAIDVLTSLATQTLNHQPSPYLRPSLAELRGIPPGQPEGQRRSLFLPHPNGPKAPSLNSPGPRYITQQQPPPPQPPTHGGVIQAIRMALSTPPQGINTFRGPTIHGRTVVDFATSFGPGPITFTINPPPATLLRGHHRR